MRSVVGQEQAVASQREPVGRRVVLHAVGAAVLLLTEEQTVASQRDDRILHQPSVAERVVIDEHPVGCRTDAAQGGRERSFCAASQAPQMRSLSSCSSSEAMCCTTC